METKRIQEKINPENLIYVKCYNCGSSQYDFYAEENGYNYVKCSKCGLIYLNPQLKEEFITKAHLIGEHQGIKSINVTGSYRPWKVRSYLRILKDFYSKEKISFNSIPYSWLDVGCGYGEFMMALKKFGNELDIKGSEPNSYKRNSSIKRGLEVDFIDINKHSEKYGYISLLNVYSHLPNPIEFLERLKSLLNPRGELFLQTGHTAHLPEKYHHKPYFAPDHISFANKEIVEGILKRVGFQIIQTKLYRSSEIPHPLNLPRVAITVAKIFLGKNSWRNLGVLQKYPYRDMYIRAKLNV